MRKSAAVNIITEVAHNSHGIGDCHIEIEVFTADYHFVTKRIFKNRASKARKWIKQEAKDHQNFTLNIK